MTNRPQTLADALSTVRSIADSIGDFAEVRIEGDEVTADIHYVGDAGDGEREPHDVIWDDWCEFARGCRESGLEPDLTYSDHDTICATVRFAPGSEVRR